MQREYQTASEQHRNHEGERPPRRSGALPEQSSDGHGWSELEERDDPRRICWVDSIGRGMISEVILVFCEIEMPVLTSSPISLDEFLTLSDQAAPHETLELIDGEACSRPMTTRSPKHGNAIGRATYVLTKWLDSVSLSGTVPCGEVRCRLRLDPEVIVGIDVAVWLGPEFRDPPDSPPLYDAPPTLAIEVLSLSDTHEGVSERVRLFLECGVPVVWIADPSFQTITVYRADREPQLFSASQELSGEPELPGFKTIVRNLFTGPK